MSELPVVPDDSPVDVPENLVPEIESGFLVKKPLSVLFRNIKKIDALGFIKVLAKGAGDYSTHNYVGLAADTVDALKTIELEQLSAEERAWVLIYRSLLRGAAELVAPSVRYLNPDESADDALVIKLDVALMENKVAITPAFFKRPQDLELLKDFADAIYEWLTAFGLPESRAKTVVERLPVFFVTALHDEWSERPGDYAPIEGAFKTPFLAASEDLLEWERYYAFLRKQVQEAMFENRLACRRFMCRCGLFTKLKSPKTSANAVMKSANWTKRV